MGKGSGKDWTPYDDLILLMKLLETHNFPIDTKKISEAWPAEIEPLGAPSPKSITRRINKYRQVSRESNVYLAKLAKKVTTARAASLSVSQASRKIDTALGLVSGNARAKGSRSSGWMNWIADRRRFAGGVLRRFWRGL